MGAFSTVNPVSAGKLKDLWDAIRTVPNPGPQPPAPATTAPPPVPPAPGTIPPGAGPVAAPDNGAAPVSTLPPMQGPGPDQTMPPPVQPNVTEAQPDINKMPGSDRVTQLQSQLDNFGKTPGLRERLLAVAPVIASIIGAKVGGGQAGASIRGVAEGQDIQRNQSNLQRANLTTQLTAAQTEREREYDTAQRVVERANAAADTNRTRDLIARVGAGSREAVAATAAGSREAVATTGAGARTAAAQTQATSRETVARIAADARIRAGKYAADAAANRQTRSLGAAASRQQAGFGHADTKPTADEDRRADLAKSLEDIGGEVKEIAARRPELFGPIAGRATGLRTLIGTDDADIASLQADKEALGQIMLGAHSMRSATHIGVAANSVINSFHNTADAVGAAVDTAVHNANTMSTIVRPTLVGKLPVNGGSPKPRAASASPKADLNWTPDKGIH